MNSELEKMDQWLEVHKNEFIRDLSEFVSYPSVSEKGETPFPFGKACAENLDFFVRKAAEYGFPGENLDNVAARVRYEGTDGSRTIGIFGHGDVVPAVGEWTEDPFHLWVKDGEWLVGRGAGDNKGSIIGALYALRYLKEHEILLKNNIDLYVGSAEETGSEDIVYLREHYTLPDFSLVPDAGFPVCYGEKGILSASASVKLKETNLLDFSGGQADNIVAPLAQALLSGRDYEAVSSTLAQTPGIRTERTKEGIRIHSKGIAAHSAFPESGVDAIGQLARALSSQNLVTGDAAKIVDFIATATEGYYGEGLGIAYSDEASGKLTSMLTQADVKDGLLTISFNIRYSVTADAAKLTETLENEFSKAGFDSYVIHDNPAHYRPLDETAQLLTDLSNQVLGQDAKPYTLAGGTYARKLPNAVAYGFGDMGSGKKPPFPAGEGGGHQPNEAANLYGLFQGVKVYVLALQVLDDAEF